MKHFFKPEIRIKPELLLLCSLSGALLISGCSRNVASAPEVVSATPSAPQSVTPTGAARGTATAKASQIQWEANLDKALARAKETQKPVMIDFYATWCGPCKLLDAEIYPAPAVVQEAQNFISVKIDVDKESAIAQKYNVTGLPSIVFLDASGQEIHRQSGIDGQVSSFVTLMQTARASVAPTAA